MGCSASSIDEPSFAHRKNKVGTGSVKMTNLSTAKSSEENGNAKFDPRLPLTVRQRFNIMKSWKGIARNIQETGVLMFLTLFETNDEVRGMFAKVIKNLNVTDLRESKELENHVKQVMYTLDEAISSLEDVDFVVNMLHSVGKGHRRLVEAGGFNPNVFWKENRAWHYADSVTYNQNYMAAGFDVFVDEDHGGPSALCWLPKPRGRPYGSRFVASSVVLAHVLLLS